LNLKVVLVGQPNCGKSTLFNSVAGYRSMTANFPGATVHYTRSTVELEGELVDLTDLPGIYSLTTSNPAEIASRDFLFSGETQIILNVIDASQLSRSLELTLQLIDSGFPLLVCLNMVDEARRKGILIDTPKLATRLGVPVVETIASEGLGIYALFQNARLIYQKPSRRPFPLELQRDVEETARHFARELKQELKPEVGVAPRLLALKLLEADDHFMKFLPPLLQPHLEEHRQVLADAHGRPAEEVIEAERHALSMKIFEEVSTLKTPPADIREKIDALLTHRVWGYLLLFFSLAGFFLLVYGVGKLIEPPILALFDSGIALMSHHLSSNPFLTSILKGILQGLAGGVAIVLPYLAPFLIGMAVMEDIGYLPRVAFLMDNFMHKIGLHGTAIVPAILGYGCNVPAVMATRMLSSRRDRFIAALIATFTPCSARMTVIFGLVAFYAGPFWALGIYVLNILVIAFSGKLLSAILPESTPGMILEIPGFHTPKPSIVLRKTWLRMREFVVVAWPLLIAGSMFLSLGEYYHWDAIINRFLSPLMSLLGLPASVGTTLIFGILRKELSLLMLFQAIGTSHVTAVLTISQIMVFTLFVTFYIPCVATIAVLFKEVGWKLTFATIVYNLVLATMIALFARFFFALFPFF
jgi:ferrous iron transport protein B